MRLLPLYAVEDCLIRPTMASRHLLKRTGWVILPFFPPIGAMMLTPGIVFPGVSDRASVVLAALFAGGCMLVYLLGRENFAGGGASSVAASYYFFTHAIPALAFFLTSSKDKGSLMRAFSFAVCAFVLITALATYVLRPDLIPERTMYLPLLLGENNSTGLINSSALAAAVMTLLYRDSRIGLAFTSLTLMLSLIWLNRTGLFLSTVIILTWLTSVADWKRRAFLVLLCLLAGYVLISTGALTDLLIIDRLTSEGLSSPRWLVQVDALDNLLGGNYPLGGYSNTIYDIEWIHNMLLDAYRLAGIPAVVIWSTTIIYTLATLLMRRPSSRQLVVWSMALLVSMTAVVFEAHPIEFLTITLTLWAPLFPERSRVRAKAVQPTVGSL
jgi:hypothetical protein